MYKLSWHNPSLPWQAGDEAKPNKNPLFAAHEWRFTPCGLVLQSSHLTFFHPPQCKSNWKSEPGHGGRWLCWVPTLPPFPRARKPIATGWIKAQQFIHHHHREKAVRLKHAASPNPWGCMRGVAVLCSLLLGLPSGDAPPV